MAKRANCKHPFPEQIVVTQEVSDNELWLAVERGIDQCRTDGQWVATYRLVSVGRVKITKSIEEA